MLASTILSALALAITANSAPTTNKVQALSVALHPDERCSTVQSSSKTDPWPTSLEPHKCYAVPDGFQSMEFYSPPTEGTVTVYYSETCNEGNSYSTEFQGCITEIDPAAKALKYTPA